MSFIVIQRDRPAFDSSPLSGADFSIWPLDDETRRLIEAGGHWNGAHEWVPNDFRVVASATTQDEAQQVIVERLP